MLSSDIPRCLVPRLGSVDPDSSRDQSPDTRSLLLRDLELGSAGQNNNRGQSWSSRNPDRRGRSLLKWISQFPHWDFQNYSGLISTHVKERSRSRSDVVWATSKLRGGTATVAIAAVLGVNLVRAALVVRVITTGSYIHQDSFHFSFINVRLNKTHQI